MLPIEIILHIFSYSCNTTKDFYKYLQISKEINNKLKKYEEITIKLTFMVYRESQDYFIHNIHWINKDNWIKNLNIANINKITDKTFYYLKDIHTLNMDACSQKEITDKAFENLKGIHTLYMMGCHQHEITDKAFENLKGIHTLDMSCCIQKEITDKAFENLKGIHTLKMHVCGRITDKAFENLSSDKVSGRKGIQILGMSYCYQKQITDKAFEYLKGIQILDITGCNQKEITIKAFKNLKGIDKLKISNCNEYIIYYIKNNKNKLMIKNLIL